MTNELYHHGIKGQKWGIRRYQNPDGTLTEAGKKRKVLFSKENWNARKDREKLEKQYIKENKIDWRKKKCITKIMNYIITASKAKNGAYGAIRMKMDP